MYIHPAFITGYLKQEKKVKGDQDDIMRVALVDDDRDEQDLFLQTVQRLHPSFFVQTVSGCIEMMEMLEQSPLPHVIFMDLNMPRVSGLECMRDLKKNERYKHIPVLAYSISSQEEIIDEAYEAGAHFYIVKPNALVNTRSILARVLNFNWLQPQPRPARNNFLINLSLEE